MSFKETLISVWKQSLVDGAENVRLNGRLFPVRKTPRQHLRQVDFDLDGTPVRGLEQNPETSSRWAQLAKQGQVVMQFLSKGRYFANVADGKVNFYSRKAA